MEKNDHRGNLGAQAVRFYDPFSLKTAQVVHGRYLRNFIPVVDYKYEPKQEWALFREYRDGLWPGGLTGVEPG